MGNSSSKIPELKLNAETQAALDDIQSTSLVLNELNLCAKMYKQTKSALDNGRQDGLNWFATMYEQTKSALDNARLKAEKNARKSGKQKSSSASRYGSIQNNWEKFCKEEARKISDTIAIGEDDRVKLGELFGRVHEAVKFRGLDNVDKFMDNAIKQRNEFSARRKVDYKAANKMFAKAEKRNDSLRDANDTYSSLAKFGRAVKESLMKEIDSVLTSIPSEVDASRPIVEAP